MPSFWDHIKINLSCLSCFFFNQEILSLQQKRNCCETVIKWRENSIGKIINYFCLKQKSTVRVFLIRKPRIRQCSLRTSVWKLSTNAVFTHVNCSTGLCSATLRQTTEPQPLIVINVWKSSSEINPQNTKDPRSTWIRILELRQSSALWAASEISKKEFIQHMHKYGVTC